jgi:hypothetical protein
MKAEEDEKFHQKSLADKKKDMDRRFAEIKKKKTIVEKVEVEEEEEEYYDE